MYHEGRKGMTFFVFAASLLIASTLAEHQTSNISQNDASALADAETKKRPQDGFAHDRGDLEKYQALHEDEPSRQLREPELYLERLLSAAELSKRASMRGFQGMRGKKSDYYEPAAYADYYADYKRAPMGFQGMRGKKAGIDAAWLEDELDKRAPMGFQGMRGKKSLEEVLDELEKRAMMGFQGMRGKKAEEYEEPEDRQSGSLSSEWHKRAPMGFQGMRGRKSMLEELDELEKRALMGFQGMRGKKDMMYERDDSPADVENYIEKRPMMMGFHGMRGKRSTNYYENEAGLEGGRYEKRAAYRFFGTRGKKNPRWESRAKGFVGVRGKKWSAAPRQLLLPVSVYDELELADAEELAQPERH